MSTILWLMLIASGCNTGTAGLSELQALIQSSKSVKVTQLDFSAPDPKALVGYRSVSYEISSPSGLAGLIAGVSSMTEVEKIYVVAGAIGHPVLTIRGAQGEKLATLEVHYRGAVFEIGNRRYTGTLPNTDFYHQLLDGTLSLSDSAKQAAPPPAFQSIRADASQSALWRVMVDDHPTGGDFQYEISDPAVIQQLEQLMTSPDEFKLTGSAISLAPAVYIHLVEDQTAGSVTKVEVGERDFYAIIAKQRYTVLLKTPELYQRLIDKNFEFPRASKRGRQGTRMMPTPLFRPLI